MTKQEAFWWRNCRKFPFKIDVPHMAKEDVDPRKFALHTRRNFLRVPFGGKAWWAFETYEQLEMFKLLGQ